MIPAKLKQGIFYVIKKIIALASFLYSCFCEAGVIEETSPEIKFSVTVEAA